MVQTYRHVVEAVLEKIAFCTFLGLDLVQGVATKVIQSNSK